MTFYEIAVSCEVKEEVERKIKNLTCHFHGKLRKKGTVLNLVLEVKKCTQANGLLTRVRSS